MSLKLRTIFILYSIFLSGAVSIDVIKKYGSKKINVQSVYLEVSGFGVDEIIYITLTVYNSGCSNSNLQYKFYKDTSSSNPESDSLDSVYTSSTTYGSISGDFKEKYFYQIKKSSKEYNYLFMKSNCPTPLKFENTKEDGDETKTIIIAVVCTVFGLVIIITIIICCCRRCRRARVYGTVPYPVAPVYGISPYAAQPVMGVGMMQPVANVQPYGLNPNYIPNQNIQQHYSQTYNNQSVKYNLVNPPQPASDLRLNQDIKIEKPH